jgi:hypothetical protein
MKKNISVNRDILKDSDSLAGCARDHIKKVSSLSEKAFNQKYELPCECEKVALKNLLEDYE